MTLYTGSLNVSGHLTDNYGDSYDISGVVQVSSVMLLQANGDITMSSSYAGAIGFDMHAFNGTTTHFSQPIYQSAVPGLTNLNNFTVPLGPISDGLGGTYTETDAFNYERTLLAVVGVEHLDETVPGAAYGLPHDLTITGTADISGWLTAAPESFTASPMSHAEGRSGATPFVFSIYRDGDHTAPETIAWSVAGSGIQPANAADFVGGVLPSGTVSFASGQFVQSVTVMVAGDTVVEPDETFTLQLAAVGGAQHLAAPQFVSATGTILADEPVFNITPYYLTGYEHGEDFLPGNTPGGPGGYQLLSFRVTGGSFYGTTTVNWSVVGNGPNPVNTLDFVDHVLPSGTITFAPGQTEVTLGIKVLNDSAVEADEGFSVVLSHASAGTSIHTASVSGQILNDDALISIAAAAPSQAEDAGPARFVLTRSGSLAGETTLRWSVAGSGAAAAYAADFVGGVLPSGTASFAIGQSSLTIDVPIAADLLQETDEAYVVTLSDVVNASRQSWATLGTASATAIIANDDAPATLAIAATDAVRPEGDSGTTPFTFTVTRSGTLGVAASVVWAVAGLPGSPANAADFAGGVVPAGSLDFAAGQASATLTVLVAGDTLAEADEHFRVVLSHPSAGAAIATASADATILNDDTSFSIAAVTGSHLEGDAGTTPFVFAVTRAGDLSGAGSVAWSTLGVAPDSVGPRDFAGGVAPSGTLSFAAGQSSQTLTVEVAGDTQMEPDESFRIVLAHPSGGAGIAVGSATAKIVNDDTAFSIAALDAVKPEGDAGATDFTFLVTRSGNVAGTHSIGWLATGEAPDTVGPADFVAGTATSGALLFLPGQTSQTITLEVQGDTAVEPDEHFMVLLRNASAGAAITVNHAEAVVLNDDVPAGPLALDAAPGWDIALAPHG